MRKLQIGQSNESHHNEIVKKIDIKENRMSLKLTFKRLLLYLVHFQGTELAYRVIGQTSVRPNPLPVLSSACVCITE